MASTVTIPPTLQTKLDKAEPGNLADVLRQVKLGTMLTPRKKTLTALAAAAAAAPGAGAPGAGGAFGGKGGQAKGD